MPLPSDGANFQRSSSIRLQPRSNTTCRGRWVPREDTRVLISCAETSTTTTVTVFFKSVVISSVTSYVHLSPGRTPARSGVSAIPWLVLARVITRAVNNHELRMAVSFRDGVPVPQVQQWPPGLTSQNRVFSKHKICARQLDTSVSGLVVRRERADYFTPALHRP